MTADRSAVAVAAQRLQAAARSGIPCGPVRDLLGVTDIDKAYAVQQLSTNERTSAGSRIVGRKIGLTSPAVQSQLGVDRPDFGTLFDDMLVSSGGTIPSERLLQPRAEAEIAFVLREDLDGDDLGLPEVRASVDYAVAALEICDSRIADWDITITDTIADNASSGMFVLGEHPVELSEFEPARVTMRLTCDGVVVSTGDGAACMGDPLTALAWLARMSTALGTPLRAGDVILSGALGPMVDVKPGMSVSAEISAVGSVAANFSIEGHRS